MPTFADIGVSRGANKFFFGKAMSSLVPVSETLRTLPLADRVRIPRMLQLITALRKLKHVCNLTARRNQVKPVKAKDSLIQVPCAWQRTDLLLPVFWLIDEPLTVYTEPEI
jgi:hypothetical protein